MCQTYGVRSAAYVIMDYTELIQLITNVVTAIAMLAIWFIKRKEQKK